MRRWPGGCPRSVGRRTGRLSGTPVRAADGRARRHVEPRPDGHPASDRPHRGRPAGCALRGAGGARSGRGPRGVRACRDRAGERGRDRRPPARPRPARRTDRTPGSVAVDRHREPPVLGRLPGEPPSDDHLRRCAGAGGDRGLRQPLPDRQAERNRLHRRRRRGPASARRGRRHRHRQRPGLPGEPSAGPLAARVGRDPIRGARRIARVGGDAVRHDSGGGTHRRHPRCLRHRRTERQPGRRSGRPCRPAKDPAHRGRRTGRRPPAGRGRRAGVGHLRPRRCRAGRAARVRRGCRSGLAGRGHRAGRAGGAGGPAGGAGRVAAVCPAARPASARGRRPAAGGLVRRPGRAGRRDLRAAARAARPRPVLRTRTHRGRPARPGHPAAVRDRIDVAGRRRPDRRRRAAVANRLLRSVRSTRRSRTSVARSSIFGTPESQITACGSGWQTSSSRRPAPPTSRRRCGPARWSTPSSVPNSPISWTPYCGN